MNALNQIPALHGAAARRTVNKSFWNLVISAAGIGPTMDEDSIALFSATHPSGTNYDTDAADKPDIAGLTKGMLSMRRQSGFAATGEVAPLLNVAPRFIVVPAALEVAARQVVAQVTPALVSSVNPFADGSLAPIVEPLLDGGTNGATAWYLVANPTAYPGAEAAFLNGQREPTMIRVDGDNVLGVRWGVYIDFAFKFLDHRSWYRNKGA